MNGQGRETTAKPSPSLPSLSKAAIEVKHKNLMDNKK